MSRLGDTRYMAFPFEMRSDGPKTRGRREHLREQIEQVLFTLAHERVFRPGFGAGVRRLVFEPNSAALSEVTSKRLTASLTEALEGEVDPKTLDVDVTPDGEKLRIVVSYRLATIGVTETHTFSEPGETDDG